MTDNHERMITPLSYRNVIEASEILPAKKEILIKDQERRYRSRSKLRFDNYDITLNGITSSKPAVAYDLEITKRVGSEYLIGIELECEKLGENTSERLRELKSALLPLHGNYYACTDGSLSNGIEIVTAPRSPVELRDSYHHFYAALKNLVRLGLVSHDSGRCGLHFHVSRGALSSESWANLIRFVSRNSTFFKGISRRTSDGYTYCKFKQSSQDRYVAINVTNSNTIEFRFFRGTLLPASFLASLEIVVGLVEYFKTESKRKGISSWKTWLSRSDKFKIAQKYLADKWPTPQTRKVLTAQDREERARLREIKRRQAYERYQRMAYALSADAGRNIRYTFRPELRDGDEITNILIPMSLSGRWGRDIKQANNGKTLLVSVALPSRLIPEYKNHYVMAYRSCGWGRSNVSYRLTNRADRDIVFSA